MKRTEKDSDMRTQILRRRYLRKDADGNVIETQEQMFRRVVDAIRPSLIFALSDLIYPDRIAL